ncbi:unnamed protein product [Fraxinus pennsylvanica]|uniref:Uncharacterized protein n=1 Tax=Fraxinus pennsylvanica TaxID=56036 RepID=A0AAD1ZRE7_9LAMI|nr:unnamed protein product [Fraxinus pennsylvanica]
MENEKRSVERNAGEDAEDDETKIDEFFALIRNIRDIRNQLNDQTEKVHNNRKRKSNSDSDDHHRKSTSAWVPAFQWEDFTTEVEFRRPSSVLPSPCNNGNEIIKKDDEVNGSSGLDLKLTL